MTSEEPDNKDDIADDFFGNFGSAKYICCHKECCALGFGVKINSLILALWHLVQLIFGSIYASAYHAVEGELTDADIGKLGLTRYRHDLFSSFEFSIFWNLLGCIIYFMVVLILIIPNLLNRRTYGLLWWLGGMFMMLDCVFFFIDGADAFGEVNYIDNRTIQLSVRMTIGFCASPTVAMMALYYFIYLAYIARKRPELTEPKKTKSKL